MSTPAFVEIDSVDRIFSLPGGGEYVAIRNIDLKIQKGEFVSLIGHSGCGKSTLLNIIAGLDRASSGGVVLEGKEVTQPGPDRMVIFQNYSLLPWRTVRQNIALAVDAALKHLPKQERHEIIEHHIDIVNLRPAADKFPHELSGGMKQRVAIARGLALRPKLLLLDEPFGALDALTRGNMQEKLMQICQENEVTAVMVTHDVDEALLLSDRVVMLTTGPEAHIGQILEVDIPRPRRRLEVVNHPTYYAMRNEIVYFLNQQKRVSKRVKAAPAVIAANGLEKINLNIGFIPLTDCAPLIVAQEKGFFNKHGLEQVNLVREPSWKSVMEGVVSDRLDAAQMVAGMPLALTLGAGDKTPVPMITAMVVSRNGNAITLSKSLYDQGVRSLADLKTVLYQTHDKNHVLGMVHPTSMHNLLLRHWLASGGIDPDRDVSLKMIPPPQMAANLKAGNIDGYCSGEPWNSYSVHEGTGFVIQTDMDLWAGHPEKVLGIREDWSEKYPKTHIALVKALIEACEYCDDRRNREEVLELLCRPEYLGTDPVFTRPGFIDPYQFGTDQPPQQMLRFNQFFVDNANFPSRSEALWILTQFARWGITPFPKNWIEVIERVRRLDLFWEATKQLELPRSEPSRQPFALFDGVMFDPDDPISYIESFDIRHDYRVVEIPLDAAISEKLKVA
ncbi:MAG: nitrate ABC transporter ATP-binding protein [Drouetiella hepatica Uher 2000/2452]|jgi:nitrate/nitrite transport system ATP-binding protein|uniref:Nitrate ABC transporter ATP-binding protein n=1 Tax=Drouetiella hepatica Uher 2000/2452 TaxID=904376 RepID=A0A951QB55_9CYAN|nr:nitrate ABC transporter ATP-binding protein [Drouetiella hepatica Uher 2000/2452]